MAKETNGLHYLMVKQFLSTGVDNSSNSQTVVQMRIMVCRVSGIWWSLKYSPFYIWHTWPQPLVPSRCHILHWSPRQTAGHWCQRWARIWLLVHCPEGTTKKTTCKYDHLALILLWRIMWDRTSVRYRSRTLLPHQLPPHLSLSSSLHLSLTLIWTLASTLSLLGKGSLSNRP